MKCFIKILFVILISGFSQVKSQTVSSDFYFHEMKISNSGCSYNVPFSNIEFEKSFSDDSSILWTNETSAGRYNFGIILVKFNEPVMDDEDKTDLLKSYIDFLKSQWGATGSKFFESPANLESFPSAKSHRENWTIEDQLTLVQGWINTNFLAVMYIDGNDVPDHTSTKYFQGFHFAE